MSTGFDWRRPPGLPVFAGAFLVFLYAPLLLLVVYSFNAGQLVTIWEGFSLRWFAKVAQNPDIRGAAANSLIIAAASTIVATLLAIPAALALERSRSFPGHGGAGNLLSMPLVVPEIVTAITTLIFFSSIGLAPGLTNLIIAHSVFCIPFALLPIRARLRDLGQVYEDAGRDLYANPWALFRTVTLPLIAPAIATGAVLAFVTSLDDFMISQMVSGAGSTTLPVYVYGMMRLGITPEVNAISTILLLLSTALVALALALAYRARRGRA